MVVGESGDFFSGSSLLWSWGVAMVRTAVSEGD